MTRDQKHSESERQGMAENRRVERISRFADAFAPYTKDIELCDNRGCAFNGDTGKCSSTVGQCYGYFPPAKFTQP